ncbi:glycoside hydrolase family 3 N-terminal domain-containing protein [Nonomuraea africana]|uniref:Beta-N-acetylhexosaminidase n=1 Tax=Nonomuraea africana TaxID=46171 RepID=A0ABR9KLB4_9ACTN|nr:glycoside hydrolase family 3 protein [Nonomuraea africana]MBE1562590.1 beta-N-acetylhexosaminidase [Nonomuraea africana]
MPKPGRDLLRLADSVILPGFVGTAPPDWLRRRLSAGLAGVVLFSRNIAGPAQVAELTAALRAENPSAVVGVDEESGEVTRLEVAKGSSRPGNYALGVVDDVALTEELARDLGRDLAAAGITIDFAPSADVNSNPGNPVIGLRAFGADPELVARHTRAFVRGMQTTGVAACAKHFPGHGDTTVDSHHGVPVVAGEIEKHLRPFRAAIEEGVLSVMTGHLLVPRYDPATPATLSPHVLTALLRDELGFEGVIITDGIEMAAVSGAYGVGGASAMAIAAGADAICVGGERSDEATAVEVRDAIARAVMEGRLPEERLADAARRVTGLGAWSAAARAARPRAAAEGDLARVEGEIGLIAARRAVRVTRRTAAAVLPITVAPQVVEFAPEMNLAIDKGTPWGVGEPLSKLLPGTTVTRLVAEESRAAVLEDLLKAAADRPLVIVARDAHRYPWQSEAIGHLLSARGDVVVVEMGLPERSDLGAVHIATYGSARVCGQAAAEVITGTL